jgi:hypothetical protein
VNRLGLIHRLGRLLLCAHIVVAAVLLRRSPMNFRGLLVMLGGLLAHFPKHARYSRWFHVEVNESQPQSDPVLKTSC